MKTKLHLLSILICTLFIGVNSNAQTTLAAGDIAVIYHLSETSTTAQGATANLDRIGLVLLKDIDANTTFKVTENGSNNGTSIELDEGVIIFTAQTSLTAGTVIDLVSSDQLDMGRTSNIPLITDGNAPADYAVSTSGDQTIIYTGSEASPTFIYSAFFDGTSWDDAATCGGNCSGSQSVEPSSGPTFAYGATATNEFDNNWYSGPTTFNTPAEALAAINNPTNWSGENTNSGAAEVAGDTLVTNGFTFSTLSTNSYSLDNALSLYPNPSKGIVIIRNSGIALENVKVTDVNGREVANYKFNGLTESKELNLSQLTSGLYLVTIASKEASIVKKLIIK